MTRKIAAFGLTLLATISASEVVAQTKINIGCTASTDCASAAVALDEGIFERNGIDATITLIAINSNIPAGLVSDSLQIGDPTSPTFLQAVGGGLDLVALTGASATAQSTIETTAVVATPASGIALPQDFVGKKVGLPGIGAFNHMLFMRWLSDNGVDPKSVTYVEVPFLSMPDALKSESVDAVVADEPMISRMVKAGTGKVAGYILQKVPDGVPALFYASTREWADANPDVVAAFRASIEEAAQIVNAEPDKARQAVSNFTQIPMDVMAEEVLVYAEPKLDQAGLDWWIDTMKAQGALKGEVDTSVLIQP